MRKIISFVLLLGIAIFIFLPTVVFSKVRKMKSVFKPNFVISAIRDITKAPFDIPTLATVGAISSFNDANATTIYVTDPVRGGIFNVYSGADAVDDGMIFYSNSLSTKWIREVDNAMINIQWYGA